MATVPPLIYSFVAGSLSDKLEKRWINIASMKIIHSGYFRKPLIWFPVFGHVLASFLTVIVYFFNDDLPLEVSWYKSIALIRNNTSIFQAYLVENLFYILGGKSIYYLGVYSYGSSISEPEERTHTLARFDGFERLGKFTTWTVLSPWPLFNFCRDGYWYCNLTSNL